MENLSDPRTLYQEILQTAFEKIKKNLPKKYKEIREMIVTNSEQLKHDKDLNANKYFGVFKLCIETKDAKLIETSIYHIHKLISHNFLDGNCWDYTHNLHLEENKNSKQEAHIDERRRLIDSIVESVCSCRSEKNENVQLQVIKVLLTLMTSKTFAVHGESLQEIIRTLLTIYLTSKNAVNQTTAKAALTQIVNAVFQRMESHSLNQHDIANKHKNGDTAINVIRSLDRKSSEPHAFNPYPVLSPVDRSSSLSSAISSQHASRKSIIGGGGLNLDVETGEDGFTPQEIYIYRCLEQIVDDVCIYDEKINEVKSEYESRPEGEADESLQQKIAGISRQTVPLNQDPDDPKFRPAKPVQLENEIGEPAGLLGWCFVCRGPANLYCKETRVPVCSIDCKMRHLDELKYLESIEKVPEAQAKNEYLEDAQKIFLYLCEMSGKDPANDINSTALKTKILSLEILVSIMDNPGPMFTTRKEFKEIVKEYLCDSILKNSVSTDRQTFSCSLGIFVSLVNHFRDVLKSEIAVFIEDIFLRMLESANSSYNHRYLALQVLHKISSRAKPVLEFYVNYDCNINSTNMVEKMIELLCKVAQGKYARMEYNAMVTESQGQQLKILALEALVKLVKSLVQFTQEFQVKGEEYKIKKVTSATEDEPDNEKDAEIALEAVNGQTFDNMDEIEKQRTMKNELQKAIQKFNFKIKYGMKYFTQLGVINPEDSKSIATFFRNTPNLSKEKLGEYFGDENPFNIKVLTDFTELVNFHNLTLDNALRLYLSLFELPGEGQKIDRVMQAFASKFFQDNPESFKSGSAAYTLSFLLIMLQTDAHNTQIKEKDRMKLTDFIKMARGINDGEDLSPEELTGFYGRILESPLALHEAAKSKKLQQDAKAQSLKKKEEQFKLESEAMIEKSQKLIRKKQEGMYYRVKNPDHVKPLFTEIIWSPVLAVFSVLFEQTDDQKIIQLCLDGLCDSILLCGLHNMNTEKDAFASTLTKFTNLAGLREMKDKNIQCIQLMLQFSIQNGSLLRMSWRFILDCISRINYYATEYTPATEGDADFGTRKEAIEKNICDTINTTIDLNIVNYVYSRSHTFDLDQIMDFIICLCQISEEELRNPHGPSTFSLQKIVEVAHYNVDRVKFEWTQIWNIMREHISSAAIHSTKDISFFAVDSLKQLSIKFLIKDEMAALEFQKEFLKPFETIYQQIVNDDLKELILNCCSYIIAHVMKNIKSGWKVIVDILMLGAGSSKDTIVKLALSITEKIIKADLESLKDIFTDLSLLMIKFARSSFEDVGLAGIKHLNLLIAKQSQRKDKPAEGTVAHVHVAEGQLFAGISENSWKIILTALAKLTNEKKKRIYMQATLTLFDLLITYGENFTREFWKRVMHEVFKPLFDGNEYSVKLIRKTSISGGGDELRVDNEPLREIFSRLVDIHNHYRPKLDYFTKDFIELLVDCAKKSAELVAKISVNTLRFIINHHHASLTKNEWETVFAAFKEIFDKTLPRQLLTYKNIQPQSGKSPKNKEGYDFNSKECLTHCIVQLLMISLAKDVLEEHEAYFTDEQITGILRMLQKSYEFAKEFNEQKYLRFCLWQDDSMKDMDQLPGLVRQEKEALCAYLLVLFRLYNRKLQITGKGRSEKNVYLNDFIELGITLMRSFYSKNEEYLAIIGHETNKKRDSIQPTEDSGSLTLDEVFKMQCSKIAKQELEREISNLRSVFSQVYLQKLLLVEISEIESKLKELVKNLVSMSFYSVPKELAFGKHMSLNPKIYSTEDDASSHIKALLNKYFAHTIIKETE